MYRSYQVRLAAVIGACLLLASCAWSSVKPDWIALYEQKLGRPIEEIEEAPLMARLEAETWEDPRITSVQFKDGTTLLGLPEAFATSPQRIVEQTVVLDMDDAKQRCQEELEIREYAGLRYYLDPEETNTFVIHVARWTETTGETPGHRTATSSPTDPHCELEFTDQWWLNVVRPVRMIESAP